MRRLFVQVGLVLVVALLAVVIWIGQPISAPTIAVSVTTPSAVPSVVAGSPTPPAWDLDADIGSVMVLSWEGKYGWSTVEPVLRKYRIGGVLLFTPNFGGTPSGVRAWSNRLQQLAESECSEHPILVMLDEEGGEVANVKASFAPPWPSVMASAGPTRVRELERINGAGLRSSGVDLDLAPVADVRTNPLDDVIGDRSFGSTPQRVAPLVAAAVRGLHDGGVGATLKHFPGLGGAAGDPHVAIPTDNESLAHWRAVQVPGFQAGIDAGADVVMTTSVYVPGLGAGSTPALFSATIVNRLRNELGFTGVVMTDSLSMYGIGQRWTLPQAAVMALAAGNDMLLLSNGDPAYEASAIAAVRSAVLSGRLSWAKLHASAIRDDALRDRWGRAFTPCREPVHP